MYVSNETREAVDLEQALIEPVNDLEMDLLEERVRGIERISTDIFVVRDCFRNMANLVSEQGEQLNTIESNLGNAVDNTRAANRELERRNESLRRKGGNCAVLTGLVLIVASGGLGIAHVVAVEVAALGVLGGGSLLGVKICCLR